MPPTENSTALLTQVGGTHYKKMAIQPVEMAYRCRYDPPTFSVLKYVSRHRSKNGRQDLEKARHFVQIRRDLIAAGDWPSLAMDRLPIAEYCEKNDLGRWETSILSDLHQWAIGDIQAVNAPTVADFIIQKIDALIDVVYGD